MVKLLVRLFVEVPPDRVAEVAERLRQLLANIVANAHLAAVRPYWKVVGYQEVRLDLEVHGDATDVVSSVTSRLATGWSRNSDLEAIWNPAEDAEFAEPTVRWAHVEVVE